ncbi:MAG: M48 family metalloprotease [Oscillospiraceae bacterium]|nr:M48 family metalloprotease [Oscillospiraceae bacterium]
MVDFMKNLFKLHRIGTLIWMVLNAAIITIIMATVIIPTALPSLPEWSYYVIGALFYFLCILAAISPAGEVIMRLLNGARKIKDPAITARLQPLFDEVYAKAKTKTPGLPDNIRLYTKEDDSFNAFAMGRKTISVNYGLLRASDEEIKAVLAHEFGHLAHHDTDTLTIVVIGNVIVGLFFVVFRLIWRIFSWIFSFLASLSANSFWGAFWTAIVSFGTRALIDFFLTACFSAWTFLGVAVCHAGGREDEYRADIFSCECGYTRAYLDFLQFLMSKEGKKRPKGLARALQATHPSTSKRIARVNQWLQEQGQLAQ